MAKKLLLLLFVISSSAIFAQEIDRTKVAGKISVPNGDDAEGINVYNISSQKGTVTNADGTFEIEVAENDRVQITALQYQSFTVVIDKGIVEQKRINIFMNPAINQLDEVVVRPYDLSGNINVDVKRIKTEKPINFDDVGIPGFKGAPKEKIVPLYFTVTPLSVNLESLYKHISGYYKNLKKRRKWDYENNAVAEIINYYTIPFFNTTYGIPENNVYDFLLFCTETTQIESDFNKEKYGSVLLVFEEKSKIYIERISEKNKE